MQPENNACIITGGSRGIGKVTGLAFAGDRANPVSTLKTHQRMNQPERKQWIPLSNFP